MKNFLLMAIILASCFSCSKEKVAYDVFSLEEFLALQDNVGLILESHNINLQNEVISEDELKTKLSKSELKILADFTSMFIQGYEIYQDDFVELIISGKEKATNNKINSRYQINTRNMGTPCYDDWKYTEYEITVGTIACMIGSSGLGTAACLAGGAALSALNEARYNQCLQQYSNN